MPDEPRWGLGDVFVGWFAAVIVSSVVAGVVLAALGYTSSDSTPLALDAVLNVPLWVGLVGVAWWATTRKGRGPVVDLRLAIRWLDVPLGLAVGVACQLLVGPLYWLLSKVIGEHDVSGVARTLTDKATDPIGVVLLLVVVGVGAPVAEEIFYRGFANAAFEKRGMRWGWAALATATFFAASHLQPLQFPALFLFGLVLAVLVHRADRLGPAICAHLAFNVTAALTLVWS